MLHFLFILPFALLFVPAFLLGRLERSGEGFGLGRSVIIAALFGLAVLGSMYFLPESLDDTMWEVLPGAFLAVVGVVAATWGARQPFTAATLAVSVIALVNCVIYAVVTTVEGPGDGSGFEAIFYPLFGIFIVLPALAAGLVTAGALRMRRKNAQI